MQVKLQISHKDKVIEHTINIESSVVIGRSSKADIRLDDDRIGGTHCRFYLHRDGLKVFDLESKNGTYLNGIKIEQSEFFVGDVVKIGDVSITYDDAKMDSVSLEMLNFPGPTKERLDFALRADFTGARTLNQKFMKKKTASHEEEIQLRKKVESMIKLSKEEIKEENPMKAKIAFYIDFFICLTFVFMAGTYLSRLNTHDEKFVITAGVALILLIALMIVNFKVLKFSIGEKISGIEDKYLKQ